MIRLQLCHFEKGRATVKRWLSALVVAALLAGLGCGSDTGGKDKDKKGGTEKKEPKPDTRKDL